MNRNRIILDSKKEYLKNYVFNFSENANDSHVSIVKQITPKTTVLDIGCAEGVLGQYLNDSMQCTVDGIELDEASRKIAVKTGAYKNMFIFDIQMKREDKKLYNKYDYIIFGDVLEHLYDPAQAIINCWNLLKKNGKVLISIPNINHISVLLELMRGNFDYSNVGLLDSTHIRFFTKNSFQKMINEINECQCNKYLCKYIESTIIVPEDIIKRYDKYPNFIELLKNQEDIFNYQHIFVLEKTKHSKTIVFEEKNKIVTLDQNIADAIQTKEDCCNKQKNVISDLNRINNNQTETINNQTETINNHLRKISELDEIIRNQLIGIENLDNSVKKLNNELVNIINSKSWKITKPMRQVVSKIKSIKK
ncbi:MAG: class I SAM-dependent methyltransferase [Bacilli bacterium]